MSKQPKDTDVLDDELEYAPANAEVVTREILDDNAPASVGKFIHHALHISKEASSKLATRAVQNPKQSMLLALSAGLLLGFLLSPSSSRKK